MTALSERAARWFERRSIEPETAARYGIYTGRADDGEVVADVAGNILVFPFIERGRTVGEKYREHPKHFWQLKGGKRIFWNADALDDAALETHAQALVITEGELDALTAIDCGFPLSVSVPDGAPSVPAGKAPGELDPADPAEEETGKFSFMFAARERLAKIKRFVLAVDADAAGQRLAAEIVRRLGAGRCCFVTYPADAVVPTETGKRPCKDLNEVRMHIGADAVVRVLNEAKPYPVKGLYRLSEYPDAPDIEPMSTGWAELDGNLRVFAGELMVVVGIPSHGKTSWVSNLVVNLAEQGGMPAAICSPEMPVVPLYRAKLRRMVNQISQREQDDFIEKMLSFIDASPDDVDEEITLKFVLEKATDAVMRHGIKTLVIDPWNELEHERAPAETQSEYIGRSLRILKRWARKHGVMVVLVVHPTKSIQTNGDARMPTPYDAADSAHFFNKADHVIIVHRFDETKNETTVRVAKVRFEGTGKKGDVKMTFNEASLRFENAVVKPLDPQEEIPF